MLKIGLILVGLTTALSAQASDTLVCVAGHFGVNYGEPGHLLNLSGGEPNLLVFQDGILQTYRIVDTSKVFQEYDLNTPFDLSIAQQEFQPVTASLNGNEISYSGAAVPDHDSAHPSAGYSYTLSIGVNLKDLTGSLELKDVGPGGPGLDDGDLVQPLECSSAGIK